MLLLLHTETDSKQEQILNINSKFTALTRLLFINVLLLIALNSEELEGTRIPYLVLLLNMEVH